MKSWSKVIISLGIIASLSACSLFGFGPNLTREIDSESIELLLQETELNKIIALYEDGYAPISHTLEIQRTPSYKTTIPANDTTISTSGLFHDLFKEEDMSSTDEIEVSKITFQFDGVLHTDNETAYGHGHKIVHIKGHNNEPLTMAFPLFYENDVYTNPNTTETIPMAFLIDKLQRLDTLSNEHNTYGLTDSKTLDYYINTAEELDTLLGDTLQIDYDEFENAFLSLQVTTEEDFVRGYEFTIKWHTFENTSEVAYTLTNKFSFNLKDRLRNTKPTLKELYDSLQEEQSFYHDEG